MTEKKTTPTYGELSFCMVHCSRFIEFEKNRSHSYSGPPSAECDTHDVKMKLLVYSCMGIGREREREKSQ